MLSKQPFLKFTPILQEKIWGGNKLAELLNKKSDKNNIGESWEISDVDGYTSIVSNGDLKGTSLKELIVNYKEALLGKKVHKQFKDKFPLLIKFIDAKEDLSIQLHPDDTLALKRHNSFGKTEMWYVMQANTSAKLIVGFKENINQEDYVKHLNNKTLTEILNFEEVKRGDVYFIPTGRVHAIGAGVLLAEIQQTSDITYRVYDWDRKDKFGNARDLHTEQALDAIDYHGQKPYNTEYSVIENTSSEMVSCPYFTTNILLVSDKVTRNHTATDSFVIYICVEGKATFLHECQEEILEVGQTLLVPASCTSFMISSSQEARLLEVMVP